MHVELPGAVRQGEQVRRRRHDVDAEPSAFVAGQQRQSGAQRHDGPERRRQRRCRATLEQRTYSTGAATIMESESASNRSNSTWTRASPTAPTRCRTPVWIRCLAWSTVRHPGTASSHSLQPTWASRPTITGASSFGSSQLQVQEVPPRADANATALRSHYALAAPVRSFLTGGTAELHTQRYIAPHGPMVHSPRCR